MSSDHDPNLAQVERALAGDRDALEALCVALERPLYTLAVRMLGDPEEARDQTQEILVLMVTRLSQFRGDSKFTTWVWTIATRHLVRARAARARRVVGLEQVASRIHAGMAIAPMTSEPEGPARVLEHEVRLGCTQAMIDGLSQDERVALILVETLGLEQAEAAWAVGIEPATFRKRLSRARNKLRPILEQLCGLADPANPCRCAGQARARQLAGIADDRWTRDAERLAAHMHALRRGRVFAEARDVGLPAPEDLVPNLRADLDAILGGAA